MNDNLDNKFLNDNKILNDNLDNIFFKIVKIGDDCYLITFLSLIRNEFKIMHVTRI